MLPPIYAVVRLHHDAPGTTPRLLGFAELTIAGAFAIKNIRLTAGPRGEVIVSFPAEKNRMNRFYDIAHPVTVEARTAAVEAILAAYREASA